MLEKTAGMGYALGMECLGQCLGKFKREGRLLAVFMLLYALVYGTISLRMGLHWDEMQDIDGSATGEYVGAGRWGLALYRLVFGEGCFPLFASMVACVFICSALVVQVRMLKLKGLFLPVFYGGIYLACIQWAYQLEYSHQCDALALGILSATVGVALTARGRCLPGIALMTLALGMYQSIGLYIVALFMVLYLAEDKAGLSSLRKPAVCTVLAIVAYSILNLVSLHLPWASEEQLNFQRAYQLEMSRWLEYPASSTLGEQVHFLVYYGSRFVKMTAKNMLGLAYGGQWVFASVLIPLACVLRKQMRQRRYSGVVAALMLWVLPFCLILLTFSDQGARVNMPEPLVLAAFWALFLREYTLAPKVKTALALFLGFALLKSAYRVADIAVNEAYVYQANLACVREMHTRSMVLAESSGLASPQILLLGRIPFDPELTWSRQECIGERGNIPPKAFPYYCRFLKWDDMRYAEPHEMEQHSEAYLRMPTWPAPGSVAEDKGVIVIRVD